MGSIFRKTNLSWIYSRCKRVYIAIFITQKCLDAFHLQTISDTSNPNVTLETECRVVDTLNSTIASEYKSKLASRSILASLPAMITFFYLLTTSLATAAPTSLNKGYHAMSFERRPRNSSTSAFLSKRNVFDESLQNQVDDYVVSFEVGTPAQRVECIVDTGSSDLWVYGPGVTQASLHYSRDSSSTAQHVNNNFFISYVDGSSSNGEFVHDIVTLSSEVKVPVQFGVSNRYGEAPYGIMGLGQIRNEAMHQHYTNLPQSLSDNHVIPSKSYSLYLDDVDSKTGTLLFGAINRGKFDGDLRAFPFTSNSTFSADFSVMGNGHNGLLDSGTSLTYLPMNTFQQIARSYGAQYDVGTGYWMVNQLPSQGLTYSFGNKEIHVPPSEVFLKDDSTNRYKLSVLPTTMSQGTVILGDSFLRSAYVVYSLDTNYGAIAQAKHGAQDDIVPIPPNTIPNSY